MEAYFRLSHTLSYFSSLLIGGSRCLLYHMKVQLIFRWRVSNVHVTSTYGMIMYHKWLPLSGKNARRFLSWPFSFCRVKTVLGGSVHFHVRRWRVRVPLHLCGRSWLRGMIAGVWEGVPFLPSGLEEPRYPSIPIPQEPCFCCLGSCF